MSWTELTDEAQVQEIMAMSKTKPVVIFKHSPRCSISMMAKARVEKMAASDVPFYLLNVITHRPVSAHIAEQYHVHHESPQALIMVNGECVYDESHNGITAQELTEEIDAWTSKLAGPAA